MTDELEQRLRRYQPSGPPAALGPRVLAAASEWRRVPLRPIDWGMMTAAAALLVMARVTAPTTAAVMTPQEAAWRNQVALVASAIDDDRAMQIAETLVLPPLPVPPQVGEPSW